jgi:zinc transport system ATP-binding protein
MDQPLLKVSNLSVILDGKKLVDKVSFELRPEEVLAVIGPNGAGKTVLIKTILGAIRPSGGTIEWAPDVRVAYLPQRFQVDRYLPMTVEEFLRLKNSSRKAIHHVVKLTGLSEKWLKKGMAHLSGGELQRVLLAWALLKEPHIILFDEPTENVDVVGQESIYKLLHHLQDIMKVSIVIVSHDLHVVYRYANHVLCLNKEMICYGEPETTLTTANLSELYGDHAFFHHHHYGHDHQDHHEK